MNRTIVISGASGYLGQHILKSFLEESSDAFATFIYALCRTNVDQFQLAVDKIKKSNNSQVQVVPLDLTDKDAVQTWGTGARKIDVCIHTAAISSPAVCEENPEQARKVNVPKDFFEALLDNNECVRIVALSTDQVYDGTFPPYFETSRAEPCNVYGKSKLDMEKWLLNRCPTQAVLLRSSIILGSKAPILSDWAHSTFLHFVASRAGVDTSFFVDERRTVVSVKDAVRVVQWMVTSQSSGTFNMGGPLSVSRMDMAKAVFKHLKFDQTHLIPERKAEQPPGALTSPLDISMDSSKLYNETGFSFQALEEIAKETFIHPVVNE